VLRETVYHLEGCTFERCNWHVDGCCLGKPESLREIKALVSMIEKAQEQHAKEIEGTRNHATTQRPRAVRSRKITS
jgi:hypothetical protein